MKKLILLFLLSTAVCYGQESPITKIFLIRHAEKANDGTKDPELTDKGLARANNWAKVLKSEHIDLVYSTNYKRTMETARPIAEANNIANIISYDPGQLNLEKFLTEIEGKTVVMVGHSNTTPKYVNAILKEDRFQQIEHNNNGNLYMVNIIGGIASVTLLHID